MYCQRHPQKVVTNICYQQDCLEPVCPECLGDHHNNHTGYPNLVSIDQIKPSYIQSLQTVLDRYSQNIQIQDNLKHIQTNQYNKLLTIINSQRNILIQTVEDYFQALSQQLLITLNHQNHDFNSKMQKQHVQLNQHITNLTQRINKVHQDPYSLVDFIRQDFKYPQKMEKERKRHLQNYNEMNRFVYEVSVTDNLDSIETMLQSFTNVKILGQTETIPIQQALNRLKQNRNIHKYRNQVNNINFQQPTLQQDLVVDNKQTLEHKPKLNQEKQQQWAAKKKEEQYQTVYQEDKFSLVYDSGFQDIDQSLNKAGFNQVELK